MLIHQFKSVYYRRLFDRAPTPDDLQKGSEHIAAGDTVFDLGANLGIYSKALSAMVGPAGQVHAVEMMPETYSYLRRNVTPLGNALCYNVAVSDSTGVQHARLPGRRWGGGGHIYRAHLAPAGITVRACRLDDLFPDLSPTFIKCDVEGAEAAVINGARAVIAAIPSG